MEGTSLFAEVELSEKNTEKLEHKEIIKEKELEAPPRFDTNNKEEILCASKKMDVDDIESLKENMDEMNANKEELNDFFKDYKNEEEDMNEELDLIEQDMATPSKKEKILENDYKNEEVDLNQFLMDGYDYSEPEIKKEEKKTRKKTRKKRSKKRSKKRRKKRRKKGGKKRSKKRNKKRSKKRRKIGFEK